MEPCSHDRDKMVFGFAFGFLEPTRSVPVTFCSRVLSLILHVRLAVSDFLAKRKAPSSTEQRARKGLHDGRYSTEAVWASGSSKNADSFSLYRDVHKFLCNNMKVQVVNTFLRDVHEFPTVKLDVPMSNIDCWLRISNELPFGCC